MLCSVANLYLQRYTNEQCVCGGFGVNGAGKQFSLGNSISGVNVVKDNSFTNSLSSRFHRVEQPEKF